VAWWRKRSRPQTIGLALSGGAVRGAAHVGVLQVLEREGIRPDFIAGTSVGALVGAGCAAGVPADGLSELFREIRWPKLAKINIRSKFSLVDTRPLGRVLLERYGVERFEELELPFAAVCSDVLSGEKVVCRTGALDLALRASAAVPGIFPPVEVEPWLLVDGCVVDNLPVDVVRSMGADYVIAVDLVPRPTGNLRPRNVFELMMVVGFLWSRANHPEPDSIDCTITPAIEDYLGWDFDDVDELEARGRAAAERALPRLRRDLCLEPVDGQDGARKKTEPRSREER
jgi:NTE family protein